MTNIPKHEDWKRFHGTFEADPDKKVEQVDIQIEARDVVSSQAGVDRQPIHFTDVQFQAGNMLSGWVPNTQEMLERIKWTYDQWETVPYNSSFNGSEPKVFEDLERRFFNIGNRGHGTTIIPNYFPEDWDVPILPTGIDLTLYPKSDFDLLRVSTNLGVKKPEKERYLKGDGEIYDEMKKKYEQVTNGYNTDEERRETEVNNFNNIIEPLLGNHPLDTRYTREFYVHGGKAHSEIKIHAEPRVAEMNGEELDIVGKREIVIDGQTIPIERNRYMLAPKGTATLRIEFYKMVERRIITYERSEDGYGFERQYKTFKYLEDVGIGFYGTAEFYQWTYGKSRL